MVKIVPFDGSVLSKSALVHAERVSDLYDETIHVVTIIPRQNTSYARENGWISETEEFDTQKIVSRLKDHIAAIAPEADFEHVLVDRYAASGTVSSRIRRIIRNRDTASIFIGSKNAGHSIIGTSSVGGRVAYEGDYDIVIVRNAVADIKGIGHER